MYNLSLITLLSNSDYEQCGTDGTLWEREGKEMHWRMVERGMEFGWLFIAIFIVFIVPGVIHLVNLISGSRGKNTRVESPLYILKKRYAKGEITMEEFEKIKDELTKKIC